MSKVSGKHQRSIDPEAKNKKKKRKKTSQEGESIFEDKIASANLFGSSAECLLPPPETLLQSELYADMSSKFLKV